MIVTQRDQIKSDAEEWLRMYGDLVGEPPWSDHTYKQLADRVRALNLETCTALDLNRAVDKIKVVDGVEKETGGWGMLYCDACQKYSENPVWRQEEWSMCVPCAKEFINDAG